MSDVSITFTHEETNILLASTLQVCDMFSQTMNKQKEFGEIDKEMLQQAILLLGALIKLKQSKSRTIQHEIHRLHEMFDLQSDNLSNN